jgi:RNase P subunit RPR2
MKCKACGYWNRIDVNKLFIEQSSSEPKVKVLIPMYEPLKTEACKKCKTVIAEPKELIRIVQNELK